MIDITSELDNILREELDSIAEDLKAKHIELGQKASGNWVNSVEVQVQEGHGVILANDYTKYIVHGRGTGKQPPINPLEKWVNNKLGVTGKDARSVAFAIAFKIGKEGTKTHQQGGSELIDSIITKERIQKIKDRLKSDIYFKINEELIRSLKQ